MKRKADRRFPKQANRCLAGETLENYSNAMKILPATKADWFGLALFPFKVFAVIVPIWMFISAQAPAVVLEAQMDAGEYIILGYALCVPVFIIAAVIQVFAYQWRAALVSIIFAAVTIFLLVTLLPMCAIARG